MKEQFDCFDFCRWSLGEHYDFENYVAPEGTVYMPDIDDLIEQDAR